MIKNLFKFLFSVKLASILIIVFAAVIGIATFIENDFGRVSAKALIDPPASDATKKED